MLTFAGLAVGPAGAAAFNVVRPVIDREPSGSRTLTVESPGVWTPPAAGYSYSWHLCTTTSTASCAQPVPGGTSYVLRTAAIGFRVRALATDTGGGGNAFSNAIGPIAAAPPANTSLPVVSGTAKSGGTLTATSGTWSGRLPGDPGFTYRWQRCSTSATTSCSAIPGSAADGSRYRVSSLDRASYLRVIVGAEGLGRAQVAAPARPIGPVTPALPELKRLSPFPVLVIAGRLRGSTTRVNDFVIKGPRRARVSVRCRGRRCPFGRIRGTIPKRKRLRFRRAQRTFRARQALEIRVTGRNRVGKFTRITFRRGRLPRRADLCLHPAVRSPVSCSSL